MTVIKIWKRSLKWDQSGISSSIRSKVTSKTMEGFKKMENLRTCSNHPEKNGNYEKSAPRMILLFFAMGYAWVELLESAEKVGVLLV